MQWTSNNDPPIYIFIGDTWYNEKNNLVYKSSINLQCWYNDDDIENKSLFPFTKKTRIMKTIGSTNG